MIPVAPYPFLRLAVFFIAGIVFQVYGSGTDYGWGILILLTAVCLVLNFVPYRNKQLLAGVAAYLFCFFTGTVSVRIHTDKIQADHISAKGDFPAYIAVIDDEISEKTRTWSAIGRIKYIRKGDSWVKTSGKTMLYFPISEKRWKYGDWLVIEGQPEEVAEVADKKAFDFRQYLGFRNIYHQHFVGERKAAWLQNIPENLLWEAAYRVRETMTGVIRNSLGQTQEYAVSSMIILGIKQNIDRKLLEAYSESGAMHVLAVSGVHVGMVFSLVQLLLGWLRKRNRMRHLFYFLSLIFIWSFGFVTAFSPSVLRAVVMFTIIISGQWIGKRGNLYNTLGVTAFLILLFDPFMLFNAGFQLSFLAVLGISYLHPQLSGWYKGRNKVLKAVWEITSISLSAQLFTFPLSLYYFNQFPTYFFISNLWIIPLSSVILYIGILFFISVVWNPFHFLMGKVLYASVWLLNESMNWVGYLPYSIQRTIYFDITETAVLYLIIISVLLLFYRRSLNWLYATLIFAVLLSGSRMSKIYELQQVNRIMFCEIKGSPGIVLWKQDKASVWIRNLADSLSFRVRTQLTDILQKEGVRSISFRPLPEGNFLLEYEKKKVQVIRDRRKIRVEERVHYLCLPDACSYLADNSCGNGIKKVILYRNKCRNDSSSCLWDIRKEGIYRVDI